MKNFLQTIVDEFNKKVREKKKAELAKEVKPKKPKKTVQKTMGGSVTDNEREQTDESSQTEKSDAENLQPQQ